MSVDEGTGDSDGDNIPDYLDLDSITMVSMMWLKGKWRSGHEW